MADFPAFVQATTIHLTINDNLNKKIFGQKFDDGRKAIDNKVVGFLKSPFENRLAVFYMVVYLDTNSLKKTVEYRLIGCKVD